MMKTLLGTATLAALAAALPASAAVHHLTYDGTTSVGTFAPITADLLLTTGGPDGFGGDAVIDISGNVDGDRITGLAPTGGPGPDGGLLSCHTDAGQDFCAADQTWFATRPPLSVFGISFQSATKLYTLFAQAPGYALAAVRKDVSPFDPDPIPYSLGSATVPEPASWTLLVAGFGLAGSAMRRRNVVAA